MTPAGPKHSILVVDDQIAKDEASQADFLELVGPGRADFRFLDGYDPVEKAYSVRTLRRMFDAEGFQPPDMILLDVNFGNNGRIGYDFLDWLSATWPSIPVVMMTAEERTIFLDDALMGGAADYLTKPIDHEEFWALLDRYATGSASTRLIGQHDQLLQAVFLLNRFAHESGSLLMQVEDPRERDIAITYLDRRIAHFGGSTLEPLTAGKLPTENFSDAYVIRDVDQMPRGDQHALFRFLLSRFDANHGTRVVATTRHPLARSVRERKFSPELYTCLCDRVVQWPSLRERLPDAHLLLRAAIIDASAKGNKPPRFPTVSDLRTLFGAGQALDLAKIDALADGFLNSTPDADLQKLVDRILGKQGSSKKQPSADEGDRPQITAVESFLNRVASHTEAYVIEHDGQPLTVLPGVFSPRYSHSSDFLIQSLEVPANARALDIGCGTGVLGLASLRRGAEHCTFIDINPLAVENTRINLQKLGFGDRGRALISDLFDGIDGRFAVMVTNPPFWNRKPHTMLERSCFDEDHSFIRRLLAEASHFLAPGGHLYMVLSDQSDVALVSRLIAEHGWRVERILFEAAASPSGGKPHIRIVWDLSH